jgi:hypothetical protein
MATMDWDALHSEFAAARAAFLAGHEPTTPFELPDAAVTAITTPTDEDSRWLIRALGDEERKWLVAELARRADLLAAAFFAPMLDAGIDEVNPSFNRYFIEPCVSAFGHRRVTEYLLGVAESGSDFRKAGAVNALYWAQVPLSFKGTAPSFTIEHATPESRAAYEAVSDLRERKRRLLLETFVSNPSVDVRRSIIPSLDLDPAAYPESHRPLVARAIEIARGSGDEYIRHRVEVQLGNVKWLAPLPHREKGATRAEPNAAADGESPRHWQGQECGAPSSVAPPGLRQWHPELKSGLQREAGSVHGGPRAIVCQDTGKARTGLRQWHPEKNQACNVRRAP